MVLSLLLFFKLQVWCDDLSTLQTGDKAWGMWGRASDFGAPKQPKGAVHNLLSGNIERETSHAIIFLVLESLPIKSHEVEYWSKTHGHYVEAEVLSVHFNEALTDT